MNSRSTRKIDGAFPLEVVSLDRSSGETLSQQIYDQLRLLILRRKIPAGSKLPSGRNLAQELNVSRNTVVNAMEQLETEGYIQARERRSAVVIALPHLVKQQTECASVSHGRALSRRGLDMTTYDVHSSPLPGRPSFHPGLPDVAEFPFKTWKRLLHQRLSAGAEDIFAMHHVGGYPALKEATARYLEVARGVRCLPQQVIITTGAQAAFDLIARVFLDPGDLVWMEEPGFPGARLAFKAAGAELEPLFVDAGGWDLFTKPTRYPRMIYVTPQCQAPLGITMRLEQRLQLTEMLQKSDTWLIEDDFDGEYRFASRPVPALQGNDDGDRTIYVGTFSKVLFPSIRIGYMVLPGKIADQVRRAIILTGQNPPLLLQAAMADFIDEGHFSKHLRKTRRLYAARRRAFNTLCQSELGQWVEILGSEAGMQTLGVFKVPAVDTDICRKARENGITVSPLSIYYNSLRKLNGLIFGYAALSERYMHAEVKKMRGLLANL